MSLARVLACLALVSLIEGRAEEPPVSAGTIWDGVFAEDQARRGASIYPSICGRCHGYKLDGAPDDPDFLPTPPIAGAKFMREWSGVSLAALLEYTRTTMPEMNPGSLSEQEFADVVSYMLAANGAPPGSVELSADPADLAGITITSAP